MKWKLIRQSRRRCGELVAVNRAKEIYVERCGVKATWVYGSLGSRCDEHKTFIDSLVEAMKLALSVRTEGS